MRLPNLNVSDSVTNTIRDLDLQRFKLDKQISSGQKITLPEDDGMRLGRIINLDTEKGKLAQYQRNASYASEFLNAGHLNLDNLRELNQRAQEISRVAGSNLNGPAMETYGNEINQLIEEALNRINAEHRGRSLFGGTQLKPEFGNSNVLLGNEQKTIFSFNSSYVGEESDDGGRQIKAGEQIVIHLNGREYVVEAKVDGLSTNQINQALSDIINGQTELLADSLRIIDDEYEAFVRGSSDPTLVRDSSVKLYSEISNNNDLVVFGTVGKSYNAKAEYLTTWDPNHYYPNQVEEKRNDRANSIFNGKNYDDLNQSEKKLIDDFLFADTGTAPMWSELASFDSGERAFDNQSAPPRLVEFNDVVKGTFAPSNTYNMGDHVFFSGGWLQATENITDPNDLKAVPANPRLLDAFSPTSTYDTGDMYRKDTANGQGELIYFVDENGDEQLSAWQKYDLAGNSIGSPLDNPVAYDELDPSVLNAAEWSRDIAFTTEFSQGTSNLDFTHSRNWKRLEIYELGSVIKYEGKFYESQINDNFNHRPNPDSSLYWKELPSDYSVEREDWQVEAVGTRTKFFYQTLDGRLFESKLEAEDHNSLITSNAVNATDASGGDSSLLEIKEVAIPITKFDAQGSVSDGSISFDPSTQKYTLSAASKGGQIINGKFIKGELVRSADTNSFQANQTVLHEGRYYYVKNPATSIVDWKDLNENNRTDVADTVFFIGDSLPVEGEEVISSLNDVFSVQKGQFIAHRTEDPDDFNKKTIKYFVALENQVNVDYTQLENPNPDKFVELTAYSATQGGDWTGSDEVIYDKGQIVLHEGKYYKSLVDKFNNYQESIDLVTFDTIQYLVRPDDEFVMDEAGVEVANYIWEEVEKPLNHVLKFEAVRDDEPEVVIRSAGPGGVDAKAKAVIDAYGNIVGLKVIDPGRYFFGRTDETSTPPEFQSAQVLLANGQELEAKILWEEKLNDPGPFKIAGFVIQDQVNGAPTGPRQGDTFSFATGSKTFLDHRDSNGEVIDVTYMGSENNSEFYVGKDSAISSFLSSSNGNTEELGHVVNTLVDLREGLNNATPSHYNQEIENADQKLIQLEDSIIDKMGQLTSSLVRMETVKAHDEDYFVQLDQRISRDLDIDLSEAIMKLTRVSTAYQAAMQVGAQLLNTSLLNYL